MRTRIIMAAFIVCTGIVMMTLRQGRGQAVKDGADQRGSAQATTARARLVDQVAALRAEVDLLKLEDDVDRELLRGALKDLHNLAISQASQGKLDEQIEGIKRKHGDRAGAPLLPLTEEQRAAITKQEADDSVKERAIEGAMAELMGPLVERLKKEYQEKAAAKHRKSLELAELERRLKEIR